MLKKRLFLLVLAAALFAPTLMAVTACAPNSASHELMMAPMSEMPPVVQNATEDTREAYQFAVANPEPLKNVPCYCGCVVNGHKSNYDCYIQDAPNNGSIVFDYHAIGCRICVDITQDVMRMTKSGRAPPDIRARIVETYSSAGPSNQ